MSPVGRYLAFLAVYVVYLLVGGYIFSAIECPEEISIMKQKAIQEWESQEQINLLSTHLKTVGDFLHDETQKSYPIPKNFFINDIKINARNKVEREVFQCKAWSMYNSVFFAFTSITTIGYGTQTPTTQAGRGACLFYSIIGIPINSILICCIGNFFKDQESANKR